MGFAKRATIPFKAYRYDFVFIHREATPLGPPVIEWFLAKILNKKIIYDFDDAIWLPENNNESPLKRFVKWRHKIAAICRWSSRVSCGNQYLSDFARNHNTNVVLNPTTIDTVLVHNPALYKKTPPSESVVIGWTGSHSTLKYLHEAAEILRGIQHKFPTIQIVVIADKKPDLKLKSVHFIPWNAESEIKDLMKFDIGIMPLSDNIWTKGKCGFKALQYMALKIPAVASPVGVNTSIIQNGENGFLCSSPQEWEAALCTLITDPNLRERMGELGRIKVINSYSVLSNSSTFLALFE